MMLILLFIMAFLAASALVYEMLELFYRRPLHPIAAAAEAPQPAVSGALKPVTPSSSMSGSIVTAEPGTITPTPIWLPDEPLAIQPTSTSVPSDALLAPETAESHTPAGLSHLPGDRVNILLLGVDSRLGYSLISRTDTMMLISIQPSQNRIALLSIPRDLYVDIPGHGRDRINTAFVYGSAGNNPTAGAALVMQTVADTLGVPVDHYLLVDFSAVIKIVNILGGIDIYVPYTIDDPTFPDMSYGYDPLYIPEGLHHFDGEMALKYARTRHQDNDFYRAQRQQQLLFAVHRKVLALGLTELLNRAPALYERLKNGVFTDLSLQEIIRIIQVAADIPAEAIQADVLDYDYVRAHRTEAGASVLILEKHKVMPLVERLFYGETEP